MKVRLLGFGSIEVTPAAALVIAATAAAATPHSAWPSFHPGGAGP
jgi:hypothetical protein